jgi:hypothetical protein
VLAQPLLGGPVVPGQGERRVRPGAEERGVDDPAHTGGRGGVYSSEVLPDPVRVLGRTDQQQRVDPGEGGAHRVRLVVGRHGGLGVIQVRSPAGVAHHQPLGDAALGQQGRDPAPDRAGGSGHSDQSGRAHVRLNRAGVGLLPGW